MASYYYSHENLNHYVRGQGSSTAQMSELDLFSNLATQKEIESSYWEEIHCGEGGLDLSQNDVTFNIKPSIDMINLADSYMEATVSVQKVSATGSENPKEAETVNASNNVLYNLWKDLRIEINGKEIQSTHQLYFIEAYLLLLTNLSTDAMPKWRSAGLYEDEIVSQADPLGERVREREGGTEK